MLLYDKKTAKYINFILWPVQKLFLNVLYNHKRVICLKKRQTGMSQLTGAYALAQCMCQNNFTVLILSKTGDDAKEYLNRVRDMYHSLPEVVRLANPLVKDTQTEIEFSFGSRFISLPAQRGAGFTADLVIIDEAAFITKTDSKIDLEIVLRRVTPTLDKAEGQLILISTANGPNKFMKMYFEGKRGLSNFKAFFISCWDDPTFDKQKRDLIIKDFGEAHANQEYPRTDTEAFLSSGRARFSIKSLEKYLNKIVKSLWQGDINFGEEDRLERNEKGYFIVFKKKELTTQYIVVADVAEGLEKNDYSCAKVFEYESWDQVAEWHGHIEHAMFGTILSKLGRMYNNALLIVEANNHGHSSITQIRNVEEYPEPLIFEHDTLGVEKPGDDFKDPVKRLGWRTTPKTRGLIINNLANLILHLVVPYFLLDDIGELQKFVIKKTGKAEAEEGFFDDRVMTLAIAYYLLSNDTFQAFYPLRKLKDHERCKTCQYIKLKDQYDLHGKCTMSGADITKSNACTLYQTYSHELDNQLPDYEDEFKDGYIGLS